MRAAFRLGPRLPEITLRSGRDAPLATFKERAAARGIDLVLVGLGLAIATVLLWCLGFVLIFSVYGNELLRFLRPSLATSLIILGAVAAYEALAISSTGLTPGKRWAGVQVVRLRDGRTPGLAVSLARAALPFLASACGLALLWVVDPLLAALAACMLYLVTLISACWDESGRAWHDKIAQTVVIKRAATDQPDDQPQPAAAGIRPGRNGSREMTRPRPSAPQAPLMDRPDQLERTVLWLLGGIAVALLSAYLLVAITWQSMF